MTWGDWCLENISSWVGNTDCCFNNVTCARELTSMARGINNEERGMLTDAVRSIFEGGSVYLR